MGKRKDSSKGRSRKTRAAGRPSKPLRIPLRDTPLTEKELNAHYAALAEVVRNFVFSKARALYLAGRADSLFNSINNVLLKRGPKGVPSDLWAWESGKFRKLVVGIAAIKIKERMRRLFREPGVLDHQNEHGTAMEEVRGINSDELVVVLDRIQLDRSDAMILAAKLNLGQLKPAPTSDDIARELNARAVENGEEPTFTTGVISGRWRSIRERIFLELAREAGTMLDELREPGATIVRLVLDGHGIGSAELEIGFVERCGSADIPQYKIEALQRAKAEYEKIPATNRVERREWLGGHYHQAVEEGARLLPTEE
ncbi:MAG: hypothetical protein ACT4PL_02595 [Phycisphaerales bacterium]